MWIISLFAIFESLLFPHNIFSENQFNPASLHQQNFELIIGTGSNFGLSELRTYTIHSAIKLYRINATSFGNDIYRENMFNAGLSFPVVEKLAAGFSIAMYNYWVKDMCNRFTYSLKIGALYKNSPLEIGGWINNINIPKFSDIDYLPPTYSLRINYLPGNNLSFAFAIRGIETDLPFYNFGLSYSPYKMITLGAGVNTDPMYLEYVLKLNLGNFILDYTGKNHRYLGLSHYFSVGFNP